jgi:hypothetical protein
MTFAGCATPKDASGPVAAKTTGTEKSKVILTSGGILTGDVARVNLEARFAVLNFPIGHVPAVGTRLNVYRKGLKVGEVKLAGPQSEDNAVADITQGEAREGDVVRSD